jgi:hypothetical protein
MKKPSPKLLIIALLGVHLITSLVILYLFEGTGERGSGDSILHYLFSKYAISTPQLFFNHWAKPVFVLLSFPFAQFGILGMKVFNISIASLTIYYTYQTSQQLQLKNTLIAPILLLCIPLYFVLTFSGLTEILFALFTIFCTYQVLKKNYLIAAIVLSFLPFVRSEGLLIIGVFGFFLAIKKQWKMIPYLIFGHVAYALVGYFYYEDMLWVFTKIPYAKLSSTYNSGDLFHFVHQLFYVVGTPIYALLVIGIIALIISAFKSAKNLLNESSILILGVFLSYFIAHSLFWYLGIFNSMGLKRVLVGVAPFMAIIGLCGYNFISENIKNENLKKTTQLLVLITVIIFPFSGNKSAIDWEKDLALNNSQLLAKELVEYIHTSEKVYSKYVFTKPYFSELLNINPFDTNVRLELTKENLKQLKSNELIIWDNWFNVVENGMSEKFIRSHPELQELKTFTTQDDGRDVKYILFKRK